MNALKFIENVLTEARMIPKTAQNYNYYRNEILRITGINAVASMSADIEFSSRECSSLQTRALSELDRLYA